MTRRTRGRRLLVAAVALASLGATACQQKMATKGKLQTYAPDPYFPNASTSLEPVEGTVSRGELDADDAIYRGKQGGQDIARIPVPVTAQLLRRGRERFTIYCAPCHNDTGYGDGMIVQRGFLAPPSYHTDRLRQAPDGHIFDVITNGYGAMYSYGDRVEPMDRWAIVAYIRALQLSQNAPAALLSPEERGKLEETSK